MSVAFLDLRRQHASLRPELDEAIGEMLDGDRFIGGPRVEAFERELAAFCGVSASVGVSSGTDAIELSLRALGVGAGDEVITAANTCIPTVAGIEAAGATPVLVDVDETSFTIDPAELEGATTARTKAIVAVHLYGRCADVAAIGAFAAEHGLVLVEDAAQAHGAEHGGKRAGAHGVAAAFSFYPTKNLGALGDAGAVVTDDNAVAETVRELRSFGERRGGPAIRRGSNSRLDPLQASILSVKLRHLERWNDRRRALVSAHSCHDKWRDRSDRTAHRTSRHASLRVLDPQNGCDQSGRSLGGSFGRDTGLNLDRPHLVESGHGHRRLADTGQDLPAGRASDGGADQRHVDPRRHQSECRSRDKGVEHLDRRRSWDCVQSHLPTGIAH